jgi:hypothetical protein
MIILTLLFSLFSLLSPFTPSRALDRFLNIRQREATKISDLWNLRTGELCTECIYISNDQIASIKDLNTSAMFIRLNPHQPHTITITVLHILQIRGPFDRHNTKDSSLNIVMARRNPNAPSILPVTQKTSDQHPHAVLLPNHIKVYPYRTHAPSSLLILTTSSSPPYDPLKKLTAPCAQPHLFPAQVDSSADTRRLPGLPLILVSGLPFIRQILHGGRESEWLHHLWCCA